MSGVKSRMKDVSRARRCARRMAKQSDSPAAGMDVTGHRGEGLNGGAYVHIPILSWNHGSFTLLIQPPPPKPGPEPEPEPPKP